MPLDVPIAITLNLTTFMGAVGLLTGLLVAVTLMHRAPTRLCHRCGRRLALTRRVCRHCGYDFAPVRWTS